MTHFRTPLERALQTCLFEIGGIALVTPLYMRWHGAEAHDSYTLMIALSLAVLMWAPLYSAAFDIVEQHHTGRVASDRPHSLRVLHAIGYEVSCVTVTLPLAMAVGGLSFWEAASLNIQLTVFYIGYAYLFFLGYDWARPICKSTGAQPTTFLQAQLT